MQVYFVQVRLGSQFEDLYITARSPKAALAAAKKQTSLKHRFASFVL